jgi:hypothetical protein
MCNGWTNPVEPRIFVNMTRSYEGTCCHLLGIETKPDVSRPCGTYVVSKIVLSSMQGNIHSRVLALRNGTWHSFCGKMISKAGLILVGVILASCKCWYLPILLSFCIVLIGLVV